MFRRADPERIFAVAEGFDLGRESFASGTLWRLYELLTASDQLCLDPGV
jgi:hypothetical protein